MDPLTVEVREEVDPGMGVPRGAARRWTLLWGVRGGQRGGGVCHSGGKKGQGGGGPCNNGGKRGKGGGGPCYGRSEEGREEVDPVLWGSGATDKLRRW